MNNKNWKAYIPYYGDNIANDFNLKESEHIRLYNIKNDYGINKLHYHYSELVTAYYIWKNQIKSDYICLWDHRRYLTPINFDKLDNNMIQVYYNAYTELTPFDYMIKEGVNEYIIYQFIKYMIEIKGVDHDVIIDKIYNKPWYDKLWFHSCFNCNWEVFNNICEFIFGFLSYIIPNGLYEDQKSCDEFIKDLQRSIVMLKLKCKEGEIIDFGRIESGDRDFANTFEMLLPLYCDLIWNGSFSEYDYKKIGCEINNFNKDTIKYEVKKWVNKNVWTGARTFIIKTNNNELKNIINNDWYFIHHTPIEFVEDFDDNTIILQLNEYIDAESPLDNSINIKNNDLRIWCTYHKDELINEYNLKEDKYHKLFNSNNLLLNEVNINDKNNILNEFCTMYYVWKNNKYSKYIGFEHYRRRFDVQSIVELNENIIYGWCVTINNDKTVKDQYLSTLPNELFFDVINILNNKYGENNIYSSYLLTSNNILWSECFIMKYENFVKMMEFLWDILVSLDKNINGNNFDLKAYQEHYNVYDWYMSRVGHIIERLVSCWIFCNYDVSNIIERRIIL